MKKNSTMTFGLLSSEAACVIFLLPLSASRAGALKSCGVLELLSPWNLLVHVVRQVPHDANTILHRLKRQQETEKQNELNICIQ